MPRRIAVALVTLASCSTLTTATAPAAVAPQPPLDPSQLQYQPLGHFKAGETLLPADTGCETLQRERKGKVFNPSGTFNAFDTSVFEVLCYPFRGPGDTTADDPLGNGGDPRHGFCAKPYDGSVYGEEVAIAGICANHQLEFIDLYRETMLEILGDFGATFHQYEFDVEDPGPVQSNTRFGKGRNPAIVIPGADNPDETVIVGAHYDKTNDGPAAAWDSQEGHAEMVREAKIMADYWKATGTRPSATIKFIPWDAEESGTLGSLDYATHNVVPGQEGKIRGYWNQDPCAGGYPSFRFGNPADRLRMGIQLADPGAIAAASAEDLARITAFNARAPKVLQDVLDRVDDTVPTLAGEVETFRSDQEGDGDVGKIGGIALGTDRPVLFSSDWRNFEVLGIPFFNPGPEVTGPNQETDGTPNYGIDQGADAVYAFHTPLDNLQQMFRYTSPDLTGNTYSVSWAKGMEFCAQLMSWGMLQHDQAGAQTAGTDPVAYFEALPNEAKEDQKVAFDATGSHQLADVAKRTKVPAGDLEARWDFGDGETGTGLKADHAYTQVGKYLSKLTIVNKRTGAQDTMEVPVTVTPNDVAPPALKKPAERDEDGTFGLEFAYAGDKKDLKGFVVEESVDAAISLSEDASSLDRWTVEKPDEPQLQPWQLSDSASPKYRGAYPASAPRAFWTGVADGDQRYGSQASGGSSVMTLKEPVQLGRGNVSLAYASTFVNGAQDKGRVQVAIDTAGQGDLVWETVDTVVTGGEDADSLSVFEEAQGDDSATPYATRVVDLSRFARRKVFLRFAMTLGAPDPAPVFTSRTGWYVDDLRIASGQFRPIGETTTGAFTVSDRAKGDYAYRVKALFADGVRSGASNTEPVAVTVGKAPGVAAGACQASSAFARSAVRPSGRGLRVDVATNDGGVPTVEVFRARPGGLVRVLRVRKAGTFSVPGTAKLAAGVYVVKLRAGTQVRTSVFERRGGRFVRRPAFQRLDGCGLLAAFRLSSPVFGARSPLRVQLRTTQPAQVSVAVFRGTSRKAVRRFGARTVRAGRPTKLSVTGRGLRRGTYRVVVTATAGAEKTVATLRARRQ